MTLQNNTNSKRKGWLDLGRGISILLVLLFHSENTVGISGFNWSIVASPFRMPLFFFISGYLFSSDRFRFSLPNKLQQIFRGIVIPYLIFTSVLVVPKSLFHGMPLEEGMKEVFMGWASWFVVALCGAQLLFGLCLHFTKKVGVILVYSIGLFIAGIVLHFLHPDRLPFYFNYSLLIAPFFYAGFIYRIYERKIDSIVRIRWSVAAGLAVLYFSLIAFDLTYLHTDLSLFNDRLVGYRHLSLSLIYSFIGVTMMVVILKQMPEIRLVEFIGKNSLIYYYINGACLKVCHAVFAFAGIAPLLAGVNEYWLVISLLVVSAAVIYGVCVLIRRYCPILVGDKQAFSSLTSKFSRLSEASPLSGQRSMWLNFTRFLLILMVIMIHIPHLPLETNSSNAYTAFLRLVPMGVCHIAVPAFFLISGFLFATTSCSCDVLKPKYLSRVRTILLPYLLWNLIAILLIVVPHLSLYQDITLGNTLALFYDTSRSFLHTTGTSPVDYPLWYVRDLMICMALYPLLWHIMKYLSWLMPVCFMFVWVAGVDYWGLSILSLAFFSLGCYIRLIGVDMFAINRSVSVYLLILGVLVLALDFVHPNISFFRIGLLCGVMVSFKAGKVLYSRLGQYGNRILKIFTPGFCFFLYCSHAIYIRHIGNVVQNVMELLTFDLHGLTPPLTYFIGTLALTLAVGYALYKVLSIFPCVINLLMGARHTLTKATYE